MKERLTSFDIAALTFEVNQLLVSARVSKIYQINNVLVLNLRKPNQPKLNLLIEAGKRIHLTSYILKKPKKPPTFCMALRKHLRNGEIKGVRQHEFDRIVVVKIQKNEKEYHLVSELFGDGNIILVSPERTILQALRYRKMRDRNVVPKAVFRQPPSSGKNPFSLEREDLDQLRQFGQIDVVRALVRFLSISGVYAEELLLRAKVDKKTPCNTLTHEEKDIIYIQLKELLTLVTSGNINGRIVVDHEGKLLDVTPFPFVKYAQLQQNEIASFTEAVDDYFAHAAVGENLVEKTEVVNREVARNQRILQKQERTLDNLTQQIESKEKVGDVIYRHLGALYSLRQKFWAEKRTGKSWDEIISTVEKEKERGQTPEIFFDTFDSQHLILTVLLEGIKFSLDLRSSIQANANTYYTGVKRAKKKLENLKKNMKATRSKIDEIIQQDVPVEETQQLPMKRKKQIWYEKFRWVNSSDGLLVIGGRDATSNEILVKRHLDTHDIVVHADIQGAPFVIIKTEGKTPPERTLREAAQLAASYSRAWRDGFGSVDVYWVTPQQVDKNPPSGEYLKKGAFIIRAPKNYLRHVLLGVAVGILIKEEAIQVIGGPAQAIAHQTTVYAEITTGDLKSSRLANRIKQVLVKKVPKPLRKKIFELPLEEIQRFIPYGRGRLKR